MQFFYRNTKAEILSPLDIPSCGTKCSLEKFYEAYEHLIPTKSFEEECSLPFYINLIEGNLIWGPESEYKIIFFLNWILNIFSNSYYSISWSGRRDTTSADHLVENVFNKTWDHPKIVLRMCSIAIFSNIHLAVELIIIEIFNLNRLVSCYIVILKYINLIL